MTRCGIISWFLANRGNKRESELLLEVCLWGVLLDGFDPLLFLFLGGRRYPVHHVVALDDAPIRLSLAGFDHLALVIGVIELKTVLEKGRRAWRQLCEIIRCKTSNEHSNRGEKICDVWSEGEVSNEAALTGFLGSSTSLMLRFSSGMIPRGSLS